MTFLHGKVLEKDSIKTIGNNKGEIRYREIQQNYVQDSMEQILFDRGQLMSTETGGKTRF